MMRHAPIVAVLWAALHLVGAQAGETTFAPAELDDCRFRLGIPPGALTTVRPNCDHLPPKARKSGPEAKPGTAGNAKDSRTAHSGTPGTVPGYEKYSCWAAEPRCLVSTGAWGDSKYDRESSRYYTYHKNVCTHRLAVKACVERVGKGPWCGMTGLEPGKTWTWSAARSTGRYRASHAGIAAGKDDFVCPKPVGWKEMGR